MNSLRPCKVRISGEWKNALFHRWYVEHTVSQAILIGQTAGQMTDFLGVIELENGEIRFVFPRQIKFLDSPAIFREICSLDETEGE